MTDPLQPATLDELKAALLLERYGPRHPEYVRSLPERHAELGRIHYMSWLAGTRRQRSLANPDPGDAA